MATYRVRIKHEQALAGFATDGARLNLVSGIYYVEPGVRTKKEVEGHDAVLFFRGADQRNGGDLAVRREDYTFLWDFPAMQKDAPIEVLE